MYDEETVYPCPACGEVALRPILAAEVGYPLLWACATCQTQVEHPALLSWLDELDRTAEPEQPGLFARIKAALHG